MNILIKPDLFRAYVFASITVLMGLVLSFIVYQASDDIRENGVDLVENRVPILIAIKEIVIDLNKQEVIIYQFYTTQNSEQFLKDFIQIKDILLRHTQILSSPQSFDKQSLIIWQQQITIIIEQQKTIIQLVHNFHALMGQETNNWDELRLLLSKISQAKRDMLPALDKISQMTQLAVDKGHQSTLANIHLTHKLVLFYGISIVFIGALVAWYLKQFMVKNHENIKLAYFVKETNLPNQYKLNEDLADYIDTKQDFSLGIFAIRDFSKLLTSLGGDSTNGIVNAFTKEVSVSLPLGVSLYQINESQFAIVCIERLTTLSLQQATEKILSLADKPISTPYGDFFIEIDFGCCLYPKHGNDIDSLLKNAQTALIIASQDEHHHFSMYKTQYGQIMKANTAMTDNLRNALALEEFFLVFQPQLDLSTNKITGIETLVRWRHGDKIIPPLQFIPLAETSGIIVPLGLWILRQACLFAKTLLNQGYDDLVIAVNVSPRQFSHPDFCQSVADVLLESGLPAKNLELEITEGVFMHNEQSTISVLHQLKTIGVQLSIDDFGTGYSSLSYLKQFPVNKLKIDQSFIRDCHENEEDKVIVQTIVTLGKNLGLSLIAEGVEELAHVDFLKEIGCDEMQGYWFSKPLEQSQVIDFLSAHQINKVL